MLNLFAAVVLTLGLAEPSASSPCHSSGTWVQTCGTIDGDSAVLEGSTGSGPGGSSSSGGGHTSARPGSGDGSAGHGGGAGASAPDGSSIHGTRDDYDVIPPPGTHTPAVTLSDIARFTPTPGIQRMEPSGWVVVGLPANIYAVAEAQVVSGSLLGGPAEVRFTPIGFRWDYGDSSSATFAAAGGTWAAQGLREFDTTPTSHVYRSPGEYTIRLTIGYRAEYRIGGGPFVPIAGSVPLRANELHVTAGSAKTVLVGRACDRAPRGPGC